MVACLVRDQEAVGSNPATPTTYKEAESLIYQGLAAFSSSQILVFGVYLGFIASKNLFFWGFIFIKISELASSTNSKNITVHFLRCTVFFYACFALSFLNGKAFAIVSLALARASWKL